MLSIKLLLLYSIKATAKKNRKLKKDWVHASLLLLLAFQPYESPIWNSPQNHVISWVTEFDYASSGKPTSGQQPLADKQRLGLIRTAAGQPTTQTSQPQAASTNKRNKSAYNCHWICWCMCECVCWCVRTNIGLGLGSGCWPNKSLLGAQTQTQRRAATESKN